MHHARVYLNWTGQESGVPSVPRMIRVFWNSKNDFDCVESCPDKDVYLVQKKWIGTGHVGQLGTMIRQVIKSGAAYLGINRQVVMTCKTQCI